MRKIFLFLATMFCCISLFAETYNVVVRVTPPAGTPFTGIDVMGSFDEWKNGITMSEENGSYLATIEGVSETDEFKFREAGTWDNEFLYNDYYSGWTKFGNMKFADYWKDGASGGKYIELDYSDASRYKWISPCRPTGLEARVNTEEKKVVVSWDVLEGVDHYSVWYYYGLTKLDGYSYPLYAATIIDGKYYHSFSNLAGIGEYSFEVIAYDANDNIYSQTSQTFTVDGIDLLGDVTATVLIPTDCCFDVSNDIYFRFWYGEASQLVKATDKGGRIYQATLNIPTISASLSVLDNNPAVVGWSNVKSTWSSSFSDNEMYFYIRDRNTGEYSLELGAATMTDHDYRIDKAALSVDDKQGTFTIKIDYQQPAYRYVVTLYDADGNKYSYYLRPDQEKDLTSCSSTFNSTFEEDTKIEKFTVETRYNGRYEHTICSVYEQKVDVTIPASSYTPNGLKAVVNNNKTVTLSWNANTDVYRYYVRVLYKNREIQYYNIYPSGTSSTDGTYSVVFDQLVANGTYDWMVSVRDASNNTLGEASSSFVLSGLEGLGEVTLRVLIPSGVEMDVDKGIWFWWWNVGEEGQWVEAKDAGGRWYEATVNTTAPGIQMQASTSKDWSGSQTYDSPFILSDKACFKVSPFGSLITAACDEIDHDYSILDVQTDVSDLGKITFYLTAKEYASNYSIYYRLKEDVSGNSKWLASGELDKSHSLTGTTLNTETQECIYTISIYDANWNSVAQSYTGTITIPGNPYIPQHLTAESVGGNCYKLSWDVMSGVDYFSVYYNDASNNMFVEKHYASDELIIENGKYVVISSPMRTAGQAYFSVSTYDADNNYKSSSYIYFDVKISDLDDVTLRVQVPTDNNMDISKGVYIFWKKESDTDYTLVSTTAKDNRWYEATFSVKDTHFSFFVANGSDLKASGVQQTDEETCYSSQGCYSMHYNSRTYDNWVLNEVECDAPDHDYRITSVAIDGSVAGKMTITLNAKDYAYSYEIYARESGTSDYYTYIGEWKYENNNTVTIYAPIIKDAEYEYFIQIKDANYEIVAPDYYSTLSVSLTRNPNLPIDQKAVVGEDGQTVTFSWQVDPKADPVTYAIYAYDIAANYTCRGVLTNVTGNTATMKLYISGLYYWYISVYDSEKNIIGGLSGEEFEIKSSDYTPTDLQVSVDGITATMTWETLPDVNICYYYIGGVSESYGIVEGSNGKYTFSFTPSGNNNYGEYSWQVVAITSEHNYFISSWAYGDHFTINAPADPTVTYSFKSGSDSDGGWVYGSSGGKYPAGTEVNIYARPYDGYEFVKWSDEDKNAYRTITLTQDTVLMAIFKEAGAPDPVEEKYEFGYSVSGLGTITSSMKAGAYEKDLKIALTATPETGWSFEKWSDGVTLSSRIITLTQDTSLVAYFTTTQKFKILVKAGEGGKVVVDPALDETEYAGGTMFTLEAKPNTGYKFSKWSDGNTQAKRSFTLTQDTVMTASFTEIQTVTLRVEIQPDEKAGTVLFDGETMSNMRKEVNEGTVVTLTAKPASGYKFIRFEVGETKKTEKEIDVTVNKSQTVYAIFQKEEQGMEAVEREENAMKGVKIMRDGHIYILFNGIMYNMQGQRVAAE